MTSWPGGAGFAVGPRGGVVVDSGCRTTDPHIWAIGEVACLDGAVFGLVAPGYAMAEVVADRLLDGTAAFADADTDTKLKLLGVDVASFGDAFATAPGALGLVFANPVAGVYKKLVVSDDATRLLGGILVGDAADYAMLRPLVGSDVPLPCDPADLLGAGRGAPASLGPAALPDSALVCSCHGVSKGALCSAVTDGAHDLGALTSCTKAGTGCGSCVPLVKSILGTELGRAGVPVSKALCEHFDHSRAELFDIVRVTGISHVLPARRRARARPRLRHLQAGGGLDPRLPRLRAHPGRRAGGPAGHQRPLPRQHPEGRHLLGGAAHPRRGDHAGEARRDRRGGARLRALHEDHRRAADRHVRRPSRAAAGRSGAAWSTRASSPGTPTARRCGR